MKSQIVKTSIFLIIIASAVIYLLTTGFENSSIYYKTVEETLSQRARFEKQPVRVNGLLKHDSIKQIKGTDKFIFTLKKNNSELQINYSGILPDNMTEGKELVVQGTLVPGKDIFQASEILTKCPSKYEKEAKSLNKN
ncbi:MAG: cytochrome c maturation protein CcmE [Deltaproteobacteria bacterium]|nr:cytochrome c maturation protein CcmE [Deltaproteobacteria bacterium]